MFQISTMANLETQFHELLKLWWLVEEYIYIYQANFKLTGKWPQNEWSHANILSVDENEFLVVKQ